MITDISITALGAIVDVNINLGPGLTVVTGETGAGKTMFVTGLNAVAGARLPASLVRPGSTKANISATLDNPSIRGRVEDLGGVMDESVLIVRSLAKDGKSKVYVGGQHVPLQSLQELSRDIIVVHGQHDQLRLMHKDAAREFVDAFGGHESLLTEYYQAKTTYDSAVRHYSYAVEHCQQRAQEVVQLTAVVSEITSVLGDACADDELDIITHQVNELVQRVEEQDRINRIAYLLDGTTEGPSPLEALAQAEKLASASALDAVRSQSDQVSAALIILREVSAQISKAIESEEDMHTQLDTLLARQRQLQAIEKKFQARIPDLKALVQRSEQRLVELGGTEQDAQSLLTARDKAAKRVEAIAAQLSEARHATALDVGKTITQSLQELALAGTNFVVEVTEAPLGAHGANEVLFYIEHTDGSGNAHRVPLNKGSSGGELSRVSLALELALAERTKKSLGITMIFDEIDAGVGGGAALAIGEKLSRLAAVHQVIVVTHLAQVAAFGDAHLVVHKAEDNTTSVKELSSDDRVVELARMLAGLAYSTAAKEHAVELMDLVAARKKELV